MTTVERALKLGVDRLLGVAGQAVTYNGISLKVLISYDQDFNPPDTGQRQRSVIDVPVTSLDSAPEPELSFVEESGDTHRILEVSDNGVTWRCDCEVRRFAYKGDYDG